MFDFYQWKDGLKDYWKARHKRDRTDFCVCPDVTELAFIFVSFQQLISMSEKTVNIRNCLFQNLKLVKLPC